MGLIGSRQGGVDTQLAVLKFIPNSSAPTTDPSADQIYDEGDGATFVDKGGKVFPLVLGADGLGVVTVSASVSPYQLLPIHRRALVDTTDGPVELRMPVASSVRVGHTVEVVDDKRQFAVNNCTVNGVATNINGASTFVLSQQDTVALFEKASSTWETNPSTGGGGAGVFSTVTAQTVTATTRVVTPQISPATPGVEITAQAAASSGVPYVLKVTGKADTGQTASTEKVLVNFDLNQTVTFATGALTTQRAVLFQPTAYAFAAASTVTNAATVAISGQPSAGSNATITNAMALWVQSGSVNLGDTAASQSTNINTDVTCQGASGVITTQTATTAAQAAETGFTVTNGACRAGSVVIARVVTYTGTLMTNGIPDVFVDTVSAGSFHIRVMNIHGTNALNGTMKIHFAVL